MFANCMSKLWIVWCMQVTIFSWVVNAQFMRNALHVWHVGCTRAVYNEVTRCKKLHVMPHLHIRASSEANDECTNHIFASSFVSPFMVLALEVIFQTRVKDDEWWFTLCTNMWMFVCIWKQLFCTEIEAYECSCKWQGEAQAQMCKCGIT